jgi:hypothetical protein
MAKELNNPFVVYGYKGKDYFCDREIETAKIIKGLNNERNITLIAPRRIGKTGLIHHVFSQIRQLQPVALLSAIACERQVKSPMAQAFIAKYRLPALSSIKIALESLVDSQFIYQYKGFYVVYDRFFSMWLRERVSLFSV